eukprot:CAMPEP_0198498702 /NCGR_PEP_ID=MMETSP1462-20131121/7170_1 /TAXON_ID=1333877 /ORGANISM="Brandtodinium nutriculum, Strain RCC3387" /LENGTH=577 /DNA_ID=CAMNT_0044227641 /DNA_START=39 /DNA_END=1770 /DNA_ORIENTATION=+
MTTLSVVKARPVQTAVLSVAGALVLVRLARRLARRWKPGEDVPYASGWVPLLGHLPMLKKYMQDNNKLAIGRVSIDVKERQGKDIWALEFFGMKSMVVSSVEAIEEVVTNDPKRFTKNFSSVPTFKISREIFGNGIFFADTDSEDWMVPHGILKAPFSTKGVRELFPLMSEQADLLVKCLKREVGYGGICHIDHWVTKMAFETIAVCATGTSFGSFEDATDHPFTKAMNDLLLGFQKMTMCPPALWNVFFREKMAEIRAYGRLMRDTCVDVIKKRRCQETQKVTAKKDIMDMMLTETDPKTGRGMTERQIIDNVLTFLFAGQDSTAAAMATLLCLLCANPRCKEKLMQEIDRVVGSGPLEWDHLSELHYLDWCIKEGMRLVFGIREDRDQVPPAGAIARTANGDQILQGRWRVPHGTMVLVGIMAVHYDKKLWGDDATEFKPERWEHGPPHKYAFLPFAHGPRSCTGREFTLIEQKITFVKLLQHFDFRRPPSVDPEPGYNTLKKENQVYPPFINSDVEFKASSAFVGLFSAFELLERTASSSLLGGAHDLLLRPGGYLGAPLDLAARAERPASAGR